MNIFEETRLLDLSGTYIINDCDIRKGVLVANLNAKEKRYFFSSTAKQTK